MYVFIMFREFLKKLINLIIDLFFRKVKYLMITIYILEIPAQLS